MRRLKEDFIPQSGKHCVTTALRQVLNYEGVHFSEEMLLGLGGGIYFGYINLASGPMMTGRSKVFEFEEILAEHLGIKIRCKAPKEYGRAFEKLKGQIDQGKPTLIYVDMPYLSYLQMLPSSHFGGHSIVVFGYDEEKEVFYISDRDGKDFPVPTSKGKMEEDYHLVSYEEMEKARSSKHRPFPPHNKYLEIEASTIREVDAPMLKEAIENCARKMLNPPAYFLGIQGILKFAKSLPRWEKLGDKLYGTMISNSFMIGHEGGTGGGAFRKMYGNFLIEAASFFETKELIKIGEGFIEVALKWDLVASGLRNFKAFQKESSLTQKEGLQALGKQVEEIYKDEKQLFEAILAFTTINRGGERYEI